MFLNLAGQEGVINNRSANWIPSVNTAQVLLHKNKWIYFFLSQCHQFPPEHPAPVRKGKLFLLTASSLPGVSRPPRPSQ